MGAERHVRLFRNGRNRAVRIPREFDTFEDEVLLRQEGGRLIIEPKPKRSLAEVLDWLAQQEPLGPDEQMPEIEDLPLEPVDLFDAYPDDD